MCGIAGFNLSKHETLDPRLLASSLLLEIQARGRDATGIAFVANKQVRIRKSPVPASKFLRQVQTIPEDVTNAILHTRYATKGSPKNNANNHPIVSGRVVGVHNGHLTNDDAMFNHLDGVNRKGQVDSEAAFALLGATRHHPTDVLGTLEGRAALAWINITQGNTLHLARVAGSPLAIGQTKKGSLIFASTGDLLDRACHWASVPLAWMDEIDEGTYLKIRNGIIHECLDLNEPIKQIA
jgi:glucosamine 6-phosphate synthetase-like amidotransferase/phosphosugar isomerase protein